MQRLFTIIATVLFTATIWAQSPKKMSYQAVIRNSSKSLITSTTVGMKISILQGSATGTPVYTETQSPTTNANGLVSIEIGGGAGFDAIDWANGTYFIKTETDPAGGTNYTIIGTSQLLSVPYALFANITQNYSEVDPIFLNHPANGISSTNITNWNTAYSWGNHASLYRPISYVPTWSEITSNPFSFTSVANSQLLKYNSTSGKWENWTPNFLTSYIETDPIFLASPVNGISSTNITNWNTAYSWGNHSTAGYLTSEVDSSITNELQEIYFWNDTIFLTKNNSYMVLPNPTIDTANQTLIYDSAQNILTITGGNSINLSNLDQSNMSYNALTDKPDLSIYVTKNGDQTIAGNITFTGIINASNRNVTNIANPVNNNDAANKAYVDSLKARINAMEDMLKSSGVYIIKDYEENEYKTVKIGTQLWMAENLKSTKYSDGIPITGAYAYQDNEANVSNYGRLYTWSAAMGVNQDPPTTSPNVCPSGWHLPSDNEWHTLVLFLDPNAQMVDTSFYESHIAGGKLKETGTLDWPEPNIANNRSGFSALPSGARYIDGSWFDLSNGIFWSSTYTIDHGQLAAWDRGLGNSHTDVIRQKLLIDMAVGVRCIKD